MQGEELVDRLTNTPNAEQISRISEVRGAALALGAVILAHTPTTREQSLAITHLEETVMWAVMSIVLEEV